MFPWTIIGKVALGIKFFLSKHALNGTYRAMFPHWPITCMVSSWHTLPDHLLKKNIHPTTEIQPIAGFFNYYVSVSHCKPLRSHTLFWHCCFGTSILQLVDMRQLEFRYALAQVRGKFMFSLAFWQRYWNHCWSVRACISKWCA